MKECIQIDKSITDALREFMPDKDITKIVEIACIMLIVERGNIKDIINKTNIGNKNG